jgi:hypothetical protein
MSMMNLNGMACTVGLVMFTANTLAKIVFCEHVTITLALIHALAMVRNAAP